MSLDSFPLFPLLPTEIRLQIWKLTFPKPRRIEPWTYPGPATGYVRMFTRSRSRVDYRGPGFSCAKTDPVALWVNRESRHEVLKHYTPRDYKHLKYLMRRDNVRYEAYIDFARETIAFGGRQHDVIDETCDFLSKSEKEKVVHLEINGWFLSLDTSIATTLNNRIPLFPNLEDIFVHVKCNHIEGDEWVHWLDDDISESGSVSTDLKEAQRIGEELLKAYEIERREAGSSWKIPLLVLKPSPDSEIPRCPVEEVRRLVDEARSAAKESSLSEPITEQ
ncbi:hypothetical protein N431DRAFT_95215 [Stipitochalara longipes BDJ]|nr:hypothetical protein N431DRAFT_95215 [Stipitochalara longipes BDJ]